MNTIKKIGLVSIGLATILLSGCNDNGTTDSTTATTDVTVTRGPVMDSVVTDSSGKVGVEVAGTNIYRFQGDVSYPIIANGGWIDVDGDGVLTKTDVKLDVELKSDTNNLTPLTTYTFDTDKVKEEAKKTELLNILNNNGGSYTKADLDNLPEEMDGKLQSTVNAIYAVSKENQNKLMGQLNISDIETKMTELENLYTYDDTLSAKENAKKLEEKVMGELEGSGHLKRINDNDLFDMDKNVLDLSKLTLKTGETIKIYEGIPTDQIDSIKNELKSNLTNVKIEDYKLNTDSLNGKECEVINTIFPNSCEFINMTAVVPNKGVETVNLVLKIEQNTDTSIN